jgi:hypothetical protein
MVFARLTWLLATALVLVPQIPLPSSGDGSFGNNLVAAALERTSHRVTYDGTGH